MRDSEMVSFTGEVWVIKSVFKELWEVDVITKAGVREAEERITQSNVRVFVRDNAVQALLGHNPQQHRNNFGL